MSPRERIKHEFLLLQGKLGEDAQFFHLDRCPDPIPEDFQITLDALFWNGITPEELAHNTIDGKLKKLVHLRMLALCENAEDKIKELIVFLRTEIDDAEETKNIGTEEIG